MRSKKHILVLAIVLLGFALERSHGHYHPSSLALVLLSFGLAAGSLFWPSKNEEPSRDFSPLYICAAIFLQCYWLIKGEPTIEIGAIPQWQTAFFDFGIALVAILSLAGLKSGKFFARVGFPLIVTIHFVLGLFVLHWVPIPHIDTFTMTTEALDAFFRGSNPFAIRITDIYEGKYPFFPPEFVENGKLTLGFAYPPLSLLLSIPGWLLGRDPRYSMLVASELAAVLMAYCSKTSWSRWAAILFLFTPRTFFVVDRTWNDCYVVLAIAAVGFVALRRRDWLFVPTGLYLSLKQHLLFAGPAVLLLLPRPVRAKDILLFVAKAAGVGLIFVVPFFLWDPKAFIHSVLTVREVFRMDSLSLLSHWAMVGGPKLSTYLGLLLGLPVLALGMWRAPRNVFGFAMVTALTHFTLYLFSTHSFCNQYYVVLGAICLATAVVEENLGWR